MKIAIVGWGVEGQSAYKYFGSGHEYLIASEEPCGDFPSVPNVKVQFIDKPREPGLTSNVIDLTYLEGINQCDKIIFTPTSRKNLERAFGKDEAFWSKATTAGHIFFETVKTQNIIGVTGSKGKGTTSTLIAKMLEADGRKVFLGGNIGLSVLDFVKDVQPDDWIVLELANFQLYKFPYSPHIAVCLMLIEEHMEWHPAIEDYIEAKANIFRHQRPDDIAIYFAKNEHAKQIAQQSLGKKIPYYEPPGAFVRDDGMIVVGEQQIEVISSSEVKLLGEHNLQNICAALTAFSEASGALDPSGIVRGSGIPQGQPSGTSLVNAVGGSTWVDKTKAVLYSFSGLEHRLELVRELQGIKYYDDSFATTPDSVIVALRAFKEPKIIILGGHDKGLDMTPLIKEVARSNVRHVIAIGMLADKITDLLRGEGYTDVTSGLQKMPDIVKKARELAQPGDVVLLSPSSSSFGLFTDYKDRGNQFKRAVRSLT